MTPDTPPPISPEAVQRDTSQSTSNGADGEEEDKQTGHLGEMMGPGVLQELQLQQALDHSELVIARLRQEIEQEQQASKMRDLFGPGLFWILVAWAVAVLALVTLDGADALDIPLGVLIALTAGISTSIVGLFLTVAWYVFYRPRRD